MLLVLDNCEHLLDPVAGLVGKIERSCVTVVVLATSREGLALDGEQILAVPSLVVPEIDTDVGLVAGCDAVALFVDRARHVDADFALSADNSAAVAQVCRRLDGVPLAIELAAARVNAMTPAELARGLDHRFDTLAGGRRGAVPRHQTLRAAIDWSYDLLSEAERRLLAGLSVFAGGCTRDSAEAVCGRDPIDPATVFGLLVSLVDRSLVVAEREAAGTRYRLLETVREYADERLTHDHRSELVRGRHAEHYEALTRALCELARGPEQPEAVRMLRAETDNLQAAMSHALATSDVDLALRLLTAKKTHMGVTGLPFLPVDVLSLDCVVEHPLYPQAVATAALYAALRGDAPASEEYARTASSPATYLPGPDPVVEYLVHVARGRTANYAGALDVEADCMEKAALVARSAELLPEAAWALATAASSLWLGGGPERALPVATEALTLARQLNLPWDIACDSLLVAVASGVDSEDAAVLLDEAMVGANAVKHGSPDAVSVLVAIAGQLADWERVLRWASDPIRAFYWLGQHPNLAGQFNIVARALALQDAETAALLQGATRKLVTRPTPHGPPVNTNQTREPAPTEAPSSSGGIIAELRRQTTSILRDTLGEARLRELRSQGEAMDDDEIVAVALDAIARAQAEKHP
jgi:predicted ATPase